MNTTIQIRIDARLKSKSQKILSDLGMDLTSGVKLFLGQLVQERGLPFKASRDPKMIRKEWDKEVAWALKHGKSYTSTKEMFDDIMKD